MFERFTDKGRVVLVRTQEIGRELKSPAWRRHHMLLALIDGAAENPDDNVAAVFNEASVDLAAFRPKVLESLTATETPMAEAGSARFSSGAKKALELSLREAMSLGHNYVASSHLLLAILRSADGPLADVIATTDLKYGTAREFVRQHLPEGGRGRGRRGGGRGRAGVRMRGGSPGLEAVLQETFARVGGNRQATTGDLLVALVDTQGTYFASLTTDVALPSPETLVAETERLIAAAVIDGAVEDTVKADAKSGTVTISDPALAQAILHGDADSDAALLRWLEERRKAGPRE